MKNLIEKYKLMPVQVRASFWFLVCGVLQNGLSVITLPIFTRLLSTEQYGLSSTYFAWNDLIVVICTRSRFSGPADSERIRGRRYGLCLLCSGGGRDRKDLRVYGDHHIREHIVGRRSDSPIRHR